MTEENRQALEAENTEFDYGHDVNYGLIDNKKQQPKTNNQKSWEE